MSLYPMNPFIGEQIQTNVTNMSEVWSQIATVTITPAAAAVNNILVASALTAAAQAITTNISNPDVARNISIKGISGTETGNVEIKGTDMDGAVISESIALNGTTTVVGQLAFLSVNEIDLPVYSGAKSGDEVEVGVGSAIGIPYLLQRNTVLATYLNNVRESSAPTVTVSISAISSNTATLSSALTGAAVVLEIIVPG